MATKTIYLRGFGYMEVPAELTGRELSEYAAAEARKSMPSLGRPVAPEEPEDKPEAPFYKKLAALHLGMPAGLLSGIASTIEGVGGVTGFKPVEEAGAKSKEMIQKGLEWAVGKEAAGSTLGQIGQVAGGIASFLGPGAALKAIGAARMAPYIATAISAAQGAGEQVERMREQEAQGEVIDPAMRQLYALGAGAGTAALEAIPLGEKIARFAPMRRILGTIPSSVEAEALGRAADATLGKRLLEAGITGVGEAGTEAAQQVLQNVIEKQYNEQQAALEGIGEAAFVGGIAGSALQGGAQLYRDHYVRKNIFGGNLLANRPSSASPELERGKGPAVQIRNGEISIVEGEDQLAERRATTEAALQQVASPQGVPLLPTGDSEVLAQIETRSQEEKDKIDELRRNQAISNEQAQRLFEQTQQEIAPDSLIFKTAKGSVYTFADGKTKRNKSLHQFHDPKDVGEKPISGLTLFLAPEDARKIGFWQASNAPGKQIEVDGDEIIASSLNQLTGVRGLDERIRIVSRNPAIGLSPLELWDQRSDKSWRGTHPGNAITEIIQPEGKAEANRIAQEEAARKLELERQGQIKREYRESQRQERLTDRERRINSLPDYPGFLPNPEVKPVKEWPRLQRNILNRYVENLTPEQAEIFEGMSPLEIGDFVERSRTKEASRKSELRVEALSRKSALEERALKGMYAQQAAAEAAQRNKLALEGIDEFKQKKLSAGVKIDENPGVAADLARSEFGKKLGDLRDSERIALADLIDVSLSEQKDRINRAAGEAQAQTELNMEYGRAAEPDYRKAYRLSQEMFRRPYEDLSSIQQSSVWKAIESGKGNIVTQEEMLERDEFSNKPHTTEEYREVESKLEKVGDSPVTLEDIKKIVEPTETGAEKTLIAGDQQLKGKSAIASWRSAQVAEAAKEAGEYEGPSKAESIMQHMVDRGALVEVEGNYYFDKNIPGPRFELPISSNPNIEQQQRAFNLEETERVIAPEIKDALKRRNLSDLFTIGLSEKIEDTPNLGQYFNRVIRLSVAPEGKVRSVKEMIGSMDHEIVHGMREVGLISDPEWALLTTKFNADTLNDEQREKYTQLYKSQGMTDQKIKEALDEEAVAMKAKELNDIDPKRLDSSSLSLINKVRYFMDFGRNTAALGYKSAEDVLAAIKSGDIGKRGFTSEFELVDGKVKRVGMKEIALSTEAKEGAPGVETEVYGEEEEAADEKYQKALSGLASKFDRKTPIKNAQQYLIQDLDIAPEDVDGIIKRMMSSGDIVRVGKSRYISDKARKSVEAGAVAPAVAGPVPQATAKSVEKAATPGKAELAPSQSQAVKNDPLANPQGSGAVTPFFVKKQPKGIIDKIKDTFKDNLSRQKMVDRYDPVRLMAIEAYSKTGDKRFLSAAEGSYHSLLFMDKAQDMALTGLETGGFKLEGSILLAADNPEIAPLKIFQRLKEKDKLDAFFNFAYAKRYRDLKAAGKDPGGTISEQDVNREYDRWVNDKDIDAEINNFKQYNDNLVDILRKSGFISVGEAKAWKSSFYIPFYRIPTIKTQDGTVDTGEVDAPKMNSQVTNLSNPKGLTGRDLSVNDAIENIVANTYYMVGTAAKNFSARKVARDGVLTGYMKPIDKPGDAAQGANVITIRENGVKKHYEVRDESLYNAVAESGFPVQDVLKGMALATEALRRGTTLSPTFIIRNTIRDTLQAWTLGRFGNNLTPPAKEMFKGIEMAYKNSPEFRALKAAGISSSGLRKKSLSEVARAIRQEIGEEQKNALFKLYDTLERAAEISESSTRTKVYQDVLAKTGDRAEALFAAMETINFSRKGSSRGLQIAMALIPFFNARIQGLDVFYRTMRGEKMMPNQASAEMKKAAVARFLYFVGLSSIYALLMSDHPAWVNATDEERDSNLFLPIDFIPGVREGTAIKFPIPQELGIVSKMLPERMVTMALGRSDGAELVDAMKRAVVDTLSFNPIPQVALPAVEVLGNFDFYTRRPIENQYLASLLPEDRYTEYTTGVAKLAGKAAAETPLPVSPVMVDHLIRGYFGTNGAYIADVVGRLLDMGSGAPTPERLRFSEPYLLPILGPLFKSPDGKKAVEDLYMIDEAAKMAVTTLKAYSESGRDLSEAKEEELYTLAEVGEQVKPIVEEIRELNRAKRMIQSDPDLSPSEKRDELNDLQQQIISLAKEAQEFKKEVPLRLR